MSKRFLSELTRIYPYIIIHIFDSPINIPYLCHFQRFFMFSKLSVRLLCSFCRLVIGVLRSLAPTNSRLQHRSLSWIVIQQRDIKQILRSEYFSLLPILRSVHILLRNILGIVHVLAPKICGIVLVRPIPVAYLVYNMECIYCFKILKNR